MNNRSAARLFPAGLVLLSAVPIGAGALRLSHLTVGATMTAENAHFFATPVPVVVHIISASLFCVLGAFQFVPRLRERRWHRLAGRLLVPFGLAAALSGLWMTVFYGLPVADEKLLVVFRLVFGTGMVVSLLLGVEAIRTRSFARHGAWMMRAYAIGLGAGTQVLTTVPWLLLFGKPEGTARALLMAAGWLINLAVAEWFVRTRHTRRTTAYAQSSPQTSRVARSRSVGARIAHGMQIGVRGLHGVECDAAPGFAVRAGATVEQIRHFRSASGRAVRVLGDLDDPDVVPLAGEVEGRAVGHHLHARGLAGERTASPRDGHRAAADEELHLDP